MAEAVSSELATGPAIGLSASRGRMAAFLAIVTLMLAGPVVEQVFGVQTTLLRSWTMFSAIGLGVVDASFAEKKPDGQLIPVDRFKLLKEPRDGKPKRIENADELTAIVRRICQALGPDTDLRVSARRAVRSGWATLRSDGDNACRN